MGDPVRLKRRAGCAAALVVAAVLGPAAVVPADGPHLAGAPPGTAEAVSADGTLRLSNAVLSAAWEVRDGTLRPAGLTDLRTGKTMPLGAEAFSVILGDGRVLRSSEMKVVEAPRVAALETAPQAARLAERLPGRQIVLALVDAEGRLNATWRAVLRDGSSYVRQEVALKAGRDDVLVREIVLLEADVPGAAAAGSVDGSPLTAGTFYSGYEHPMARNEVRGSAARCGFVRNAPLLPGEELTQGLVLGVAPPGQLRRGFLHYVERERAHPYRPYLHYNSWWDIAWGSRKFTEAECLQAIECFGRELVTARGVAMDGFVFDDGWDDNQTLWRFHAAFPNGFTPLREAAAKYKAGIGTWLSPFGGYGRPKEERLRFGREQGFETNADGFSMAGPRYGGRFREICLEMIRSYGVNHFKFDGLAAGAKATGGPLRDGDAMLRLIRELRDAAPDLFVNQTTGTWPSPFWLLHVDSTWRGGDDDGFHGAGSPRQRWITYRDMDTYRKVVRRGPLYPLNALMTCGIIFATNEKTLRQADPKDFRDEVRSFFGSGTQLQELYITPQLLTPRHWDLLAEAARWARPRAGTLVDTHWVGGDPGTGEAYGWAAWSPGRGILVLRNPADAAREIAVDAAQAFELPAGAPAAWALTGAYPDQRVDRLALEAGVPKTIALDPFEVLVFDAVPAGGGKGTADERR